MNLEMLKTLLSPLAYLRISHEAKLWADWIYPIILAAGSAYLVMKFGRLGVVTGSGGLVEKVLITCSVLPGFYIAALAAIATFNRPDIDELMPEPSPTMMVNIGGQLNQIRLTRRRLLAHLFGFLCFESLVIMTISMFASLVGLSLALTLTPDAASILRLAFIFGILILFWQMLCVTVLGLHYLGDRLYRPF